MHLIPAIKVTISDTTSNGYRHANVTRHWLWKTKLLLSIPLFVEFWPSTFKVPVTKGVRFPKEPKPSDEEVRIMKDFVDSRGYKVLRKFWNWRLLGLTFSCTSSREDSEYARGKFQGFMEARVIAEKIAEFGAEVEGEVSESTEDMYINMREMDREAEQVL